MQTAPKARAENIKGRYGEDGFIAQSYFSIYFDSLGILKHHLIFSLYSVRLGVHIAITTPVKHHLVFAQTEKDEAQ